MPRIQYGLSSYKRGRGDLPELPVINMFAEDAPTEDGQVLLQSRPGLADRGESMGAGPVQALFQRDLVLDSALFGVSAGKLYQGTTLIGTIDGTGPVTMGGYQNYLFVCAGASIWVYDGTTLSALAFPDGADVAAIVVGASRLVAIRKDTGKFYWSDPLETDIEALDFATAENSPDRLKHLLFIDDVLVNFGAETVEFWPNTGDSELPFQPLEGRVIEKGIKATGCATAIGSTFAWVTNENQVCFSDENTIVSNPGLEDRIEASSECSLFTFLLGGLECLALRIDNETQFMPLKTRMWHELESYGQTNWIPQCYAGGVFGSSIDGKTLAFGNGHADYNTTAGNHERRFRAGFRSDVPLTVSNLVLNCNVGQATDLTGDFVNPQIEMRVSLNHGKTWGQWRAVSLGAQGEYNRVVTWRNLGITRRGFGWLCEFRVTAPVDFRASDVKVNQPTGGR